MRKILKRVGDFSIQTKFLTGTIAIILLLGISMVILVQTVVYDNLINELQKRSIYKAENIAYECSRYLLIGDILSIRSLVFEHKERHGERIEYVFILDAKGKVLAHTFEEGFPVDLRGINVLGENQTYNIERLVAEKGIIYDTAVPILEGTLGVVHLGTREKPIIMAVGKIIKLILGVTAGVLTLGVVFAVILSRLITKPIFELIRATKAVSKGKLNEEVHVTTTDEIGQLATFFNKMTKELKALWNKLEQAKITLEEKVRDRTEALEESRNKLREHAERLEDKVKERTKDLTKLMRESDEKRLAIINMLEDINESRNKLEKVNKELKETQEQLIQAGKMSAIGELAGGVAHEINNPLTGVLNNVQLIKLEAESQKDFKLKDFQELLDIIEESARRCARVTRALLDFSRLSHGEFEPLNINEVIEGSFILGSHELRLEEIDIVKELTPDLPNVLGNSNQLQQVLLNLSSNAKNALRDIKEKKKLIVKTSALPDNKSIQIKFSDNGCGIPKENLDKIFEPFFTTMEVGKGTGLGLSISYSIIQAHRGNIEVTSKEGEGATFTIALPAAKK